MNTSRITSIGLILLFASIAFVACSPVYPQNAKTAEPPEALMLTPGDQPNGTPTAPAAAVSTPGAEVDELFINMMVPHHQGAVEMAMIALQRAEHDEIKDMANNIINSQQAEITKLKDWKLQWYGTRDTPPMSSMPMMQAMPGMSGGPIMNMQAEVDALKNAPEPFDLAFIDSMILHHQLAIDAALMVQDTAIHPEIRAMAESIIEEQQREIDQLTAWRKAWY